MPIKGLTDRGAPTFPKIGDIRKGAKKTDPKRPGPDLTYFRFASITGEEEVAALFAEIYGDEPREINVFLPFDETSRNFEAWMERHTASALQCRGDGETAFLWREKGKMQHAPKKCPSPRCADCVETGRLKIIVPELKRLAYVTVHTTSIWDIIELTANLDALRKLTGNGVKGIPLVLKRRPRSISTPTKDGSVRREKWLLSIEADPRWVKAQLAAMERAALPAGDYTHIEAPEVDTITDEITGEWDGELFDQNEPEVDESPADDTSPAVQAAMDYTTDSGAVLGKLGPDELVAMVDKIDGLPRPTAKMKTIKGHCLTLLEYLKQFEQK